MIVQTTGDYIYVFLKLYGLVSASMDKEELEFGLGIKDAKDLADRINKHLEKRNDDA